MTRHFRSVWVRLRKPAVRAGRKLGTINVEAVADRVIQFVEAIFLIAAVRFLLSIQSEDFALVISLLLSLLAGSRIGMPFVHWLREGKGPRRDVVLAGVVIGFGLFMSSMPLAILVEATFDVDRQAARERLAEWNDGGRMIQCARGGRLVSDCEDEFTAAPEED